MPITVDFFVDFYDAYVFVMVATFMVAGQVPHLRISGYERKINCVFSKECVKRALCARYFAFIFHCFHV